MSGGARTKLRASKGVTRRPPPVRRTADLSLNALRRSFPDRAPVNQPTHLQPALKIGAANDPLEREAETTAERIVSMPSPALAAPLADPSPGGVGPGGPGEARRASVNDQPSTEALETAPPIPADHQDPDVPKDEDVDTTELAEDDMKEIESGAPEDTAGEPPAEETPPPADDQPAAQPARSGDAAVVGAEGGAAPADVTRRVAQPGSGRPLPAMVRAFMEPRFGKDFSDVRIHDAADDRTAARWIGARAFTHRQHIWIGPGETVENRRLMAHELTHVVQQTKRRPLPVINRQVDPSEETGEPEVRRGYFADKAEKYARNVPGYRLVSFILGKSPITGNRVARNATNLIGALLAMIPGGNLLFERLQETRVIEKAFEWISGRLSSLNITWSRIKGLISDFFDYLPAWPSNAVSYAKKLFGPIVRDILTFIGEVKDKILEFIIRGALKLAGPLAEKVWGVIKKVGNVISTILKDPLGFAKNLFRAVHKGFTQFGSHILEHIKQGLLGWLFGAIRGLDIQIPEKLDFKGLISIGLQVVGLTYANFRAKLVKRLGRNGERKVAFLEKSVEVVKILVKEGFVGLWQRVLQMIDNFTQTIVGGIRDFVIKSLIMGGLSWLAGLSNPVGAVVKVVLAIYNIIKTFLERLDQILEVANSIFSSIGAIASGKIQQAADFIEKTIASTIPVVISFLAALVPITGITSAIRNIIKKLRAPVTKAMDKMIKFLVKKAKKLFSRIIGKLNKKRKLPSANIRIGKTTHQYYAKKVGKKVDVFVKSSEMKADDAKNCMKKEVPKFREADSPAADKVAKLATTFDTEESQAQKIADTIKSDSKSKNNVTPSKKLGDELSQGSKKVTESGEALTKEPEVATDDPTCFIRYIAQRYENEGKADKYSVLKNLMKKAPPGPGNVAVSATFERDHIPTKKTLRAIAGAIGGGEKKERKTTPVTRAGTPPKSAEENDSQPLGLLHTAGVESDAESHEAIILYAKIHTAKEKEDDNAVRIASSTKPLDEKIGDFKTHLIAHVKKETDLVRKHYSKEKVPEIIAKVEQGLVDITNKANENFKLGKADVDRPEAADIPKGSREILLFENVKDRSAPDFAKNEGRTGAHKYLANNFVKRGLLESDHLIDNSYIEAVNKWTVGDAWTSISKSIEDDIGALPEREREAARKRRDTLAATPLFTKSAMRNYTRDKGRAIVVFKGVHDKVDQIGKAKVQQDIKGVFNASSLSGVKEYIMGTGGAEPAVLAEGLQSAIRKPFDKRFKKHQGIITNKYNEQRSDVLGLNLTDPEGAGREMDKILQRVKESIDTLRQETSNLFG